MPRLRWPSPPSPWFIKDRSYLPTFAAQIHSFIHSFIHSSFGTVPMEKYCSLWAKNLKILSKVDLIEIHHMSRNRVCTYLSSLTIKVIVVRIWYMFSNIHQGPRENPKIMKIFVRVAERNVNNHKYRLFFILPYLSCKGQPTLLYKEICFSYNFFRSWPNWTKLKPENVQGIQDSAYIILLM